MNIKEIDIDQIMDYIQQEKAKGRTVKDIVKEIVAVRSDVIVLSHDPIIGHQQIIAALKQYQK